MGACISSFSHPSPRREVAATKTVVSSASTPVTFREHRSFDLPFDGYNPEINIYRSVLRVPNEKRSPSIAVLQRVIADRETQANCNVVGGISPVSSEGRLPTRKRQMSIVERTRRMSSIMNEFSERINSLLSMREDEDNESYLKRAFLLLDSQGRDALSEENLVKGLGALRSRHLISTMFAAADGNKDGYLDWEEFSRFFRYLKESNCILAENADLDFALERNMQNKIIQKTPVRQYLRDIKVLNLPSQAGRIKCIAMSGDLEMYAVSHRNDCTVHLYTLAGIEVRQLTGHSNSLLGITFSPDKRYIATASRDWTMILWDSTAGQAVQCVQHDGVVTAVAFSFNGRFLYTGCQDNIVRRLSIPKGKLKATLKGFSSTKPGVIVALATQHTKNEYVVFSRSCDKSAYIVDALNLAEPRQLSGHNTIVWHVRYNPDDSLILTGCEERLKIWNAQYLTIVADFDSKAFTLNDCGAFCTAAVFFPLGYENMLMVFTSRRQFYVINIDTGDILLDFTLRAPVYASASDFTSHGLVCGDDYGNVYNIKLL
ncbi:putative WD40 repeat-containing protein [Trypanosoma theileri]|uniref:Putative WD40 repeat-containing protein n=1 Tax=Trypanosoma theileri TaxID=67003 RepID=A0A1X0NSH5_9TRYP|nr:putative WD40 repeat-containing protein [Trypanosoma theileri]ORC87508.1 putative WD40 repeat-containing protein [Trypanosoma theileri]